VRRRRLRSKRRLPPSFESLSELAVTCSVHTASQSVSRSVGRSVCLSSSSPCFVDDDRHVQTCRCTNGNTARPAAQVAQPIDEGLGSARRDDGARPPPIASCRSRPSGRPAVRMAAVPGSELAVGPARPGVRSNSTQYRRRRRRLSTDRRGAGVCRLSPASPRRMHPPVRPALHRQHSVPEASCFRAALDASAAMPVSSLFFPSDNFTFTL